MSYLIDSNVLITAKNFYYDPSICPGFWEWMEYSFNSSKIKSIDLVKRELEKQKKDTLAVWLREKKQNHWFAESDDFHVIEKFREVQEYVMSQGYMPAALDDFFREEVADPWLIAHGMVSGDTIVTLEKPKPANTKKSVPMASLCEHFGVSYIDTFNLLRQFNASFHLK
ncbi:DUF4411 family protein [Gallaecimonas kandeliae]|uniref:DUF4411 family protein n=1 Tax=Gallaecimonas kandeliae TaxID=3029055 RepID=UPI00264977C0|nr:DUF4411 family protein [Gallaecimonas kandeliae]WKE66218.1 DUF4411 family protein [Gallaecimonas kandeliae]